MELVHVFVIILFGKKIKPVPGWDEKIVDYSGFEVKGGRNIPRKQMLSLQDLNGNAQTQSTSTTFISTTFILGYICDEK